MLGIVSHLGVIDSIWEAMHRFRVNTMAFYRMSYGAWLDFYIGWGVLELVPWENRNCEHDKSGTSACVQAARFACVASAVPQGEQHTVQTWLPQSGPRLRDKPLESLTPGRLATNSQTWTWPAAYPSQIAQPGGSQPTAGQRVKGGLLLSPVMAITDEIDHLKRIFFKISFGHM